MPSAAFANWTSLCLPRLDELERVHRDATGPGPGRRWGTTQFNRNLFVTLVAQFQTYCRDLHDEAVAVHVSNANPRQADFLRNLLTQGKKLDFTTPRTDTLGSDFGRLGFGVIDAIKAEGARSKEDLRRLDLLVDFRNAIGHGNEAEIAALTAGGEIDATKTTYRRYRRAIQRLAATMDQVVGTMMAAELGIPAPW
jgi:hypothetical protein